ncbi:hypothetical protein ACOSQ3_006622 [Xanthoceras sorbifolium]
MASFIMWQAREELTVRYTPEHNVNTVIYILNRAPTKAVLNKTPFEAWHKQKPQVSFLKVFGCIAYSHIPSQFREKFDEKGEKYIFVGYSDELKGYRLLNPKIEELLILRNVPHHQVHLAHQVQARVRQIHQAHQIRHTGRCDLLKTFIIHVI